MLYWQSAKTVLWGKMLVYGISQAITRWRHVYIVQCPTEANGINSIQAMQLYDDWLAQYFYIRS